MTAVAEGSVDGAPGPAVDAALVEAVTEILEVTAFELADVIEAGAPPPDAIGATIAFHGPPSGVMRMWIEPGEARAFAASALGLDDPTAGAIEDAVRELANMIAGHVLGRLWTEVCVGLDGAQLAAVDDRPYPVQLAGEHGRIAIAMEVGS